jgi:hypothetical protein
MGLGHHKKTDVVHTIDELVDLLRRGDSLVEDHLHSMEQIIFGSDGVSWNHICDIADAINSFESCIDLLTKARPGWGHGYEVDMVSDKKHYQAWIWPSIEVSDKFWEPDWKLGQETYQDHPKSAFRLSNCAIISEIFIIGSYN